MQGNIPKPFSRPRIEAVEQSYSDGVQRVWQHVPTSSLEAGDTVADKGLVTETLAGAQGLEVTFASGSKIYSSLTPSVHAFTRFI